MHSKESYSVILFLFQDPGIQVVNVTVEIKYHYAVTKVIVDYLNPSEEDHETNFDVAIPETAFITGLDLYELHISFKVLK